MLDFQRTRARELAALARCDGSLQDPLGGGVQDGELSDSFMQALEKELDETLRGQGASEHSAPAASSERPSGQATLCPHVLSSHRQAQLQALLQGRQLQQRTSRRLPWNSTSRSTKHRLNEVLMLVLGISASRKRRLLPRAVRLALRRGHQRRNAVVSCAKRHQRRSHPCRRKVFGPEMHLRALLPHQVPPRQWPLLTRLLLVPRLARHSPAARRNPMGWLAL